jgi:hypothetical protein
MGLFSRMGEMGITGGEIDKAMEKIRERNGGRVEGAEKRLSPQPSVEGGESAEKENVTFEKIKSAAIELYIAIERFKREYGIAEDEEGEMNFFPVLGSKEAEKIIELIDNIAGADDQESIKRVREEIDIFKRVFLNGKIIEALGALKEKRIKLCALRRELRRSGLIIPFFAAIRGEKARKDYSRSVDNIMGAAKEIDLLTSEYSLAIKKVIGIVKDFIRLKNSKWFFIDFGKATRVEEKFNFLAFEGGGVFIDWKDFYMWCQNELLEGESDDLLI